jgi:sulfide:quinone oxidoreductase
MKKILVLGSNFGGFTAAVELKRKLKGNAEVTVISPTDKFTYVPSLIWVPFGRRKVSDITMPVRPLFERAGVQFVKDASVKIRPEENKVDTKSSGTFDYDYLVVATGVEMNFDVIEHLNPAEGFVETIVLPHMAEHAYEKFQELVKDPGPIVVGATQGASCMGAAYEYLFNMDTQLRKAGVRDKVSITWITPEPFLGHFGIGGIKGGQTMLEMFCKMYNINWVTNASISSIEKNKITLHDGTELPFKLAMLMPPFKGAQVMFNSPELSDAKGFVEVNEGYQSIKYPNIFAAGLAVTVKAPFSCQVPFGVPKTGYPTDVSAKIVAHNISTLVTGKGKFKQKSWGKIPGLCVMDAGNKEVIIVTDHLFKPRKFAAMVPNMLGDFSKVLLEKYFLWKISHGYAWMP